MTDRPTKTSSDLKRLGEYFTRFLLGIAIILAILELFLHRHGVAPIEDSFLFPGVFGFLAFMLIVQVGKWLRQMIMRPEDYYEGGTSDD